MRIALALLVAWTSSTASAGIQLAIPNALLVVDENNDRVLRVALDGGAVTVFSPPEGAQVNLLDEPRGIGTGPDGTIVVANYFTGTLVEIDPATGAQFPVAGLFSGPPAIGSLPRDVALNPREPAPGFLPTLGVAAQGELHQVVRNALDTTGSLLAPYPSPYDPYLARFIVARDPGTDDPIDYFVATDAIAALLRYDGAADSFTPIWDDPALDSIHGLDAPSQGPYLLVASFRDEPCPSLQNGIRYFTSTTSDGGLEIAGGSATCPGPVAYGGVSEVTWFVDAGSQPQTICAITGTGVTLSMDPVATLPSGASAIDMTLASVPEPGGAGITLLTLVVLGARRACAL